MKKKDFKKQLQLAKKTISSLDQKGVKGGGNPNELPSHVTIQLTTMVTVPRVCETKGDVCTMYCETNDLCN